MLMYILLIAAAIVLDVESNNNQYQNDNNRPNPLKEDYLRKWKLGIPSRDYSASVAGDDNFGEYPEYDYSSIKDGKNSGRDMDYASSIPMADTSFTEKKVIWPKTRESHVTRKGEAIHPFVNSTLKTIENWPNPEKKLGQLSAVSIDNFGNVVVFHRGDRVWNSQTFLQNNVYNERSRGPIKDNTIVGFNAETGNVVFEWGREIFYLPHGLTVDKENNVWVTDVALHQVLKFPSGGNANQPVLTLGKKFFPGSDMEHFCKPTAVAVMKNGDFFVSDGYCNDRILKYDKNAKLLTHWGRKTYFGPGVSYPAPNAFSIPHALALAKEETLLCVADRENGRLECFYTYNGSFAFQLHSPEFGSRLFSVAFSPAQGGFLYAINGPEPASFGPVRGFKIDINTKNLVEEIRPNGGDFSNPHDIAVTEDGKQVYVVELQPFKLWKFSQEEKDESISKSSQIGLPLKVENTSQSSILKPSYTSSQTVYNKNMTILQTNEVFEELKQERYLSQTTEIILIVVSVLIVCLIIISVVAFIKIQGKGQGCSLCPRRWRAYNNSSSDGGFKLGQLLDPHSGFEKVCTEESDEDDEDEEEELVESLGVNLNSVGHTLSHAQQA